MDGTLVIDPDWKEEKTDVIAYMQRYNLPEECEEVLYLEVVGHNWALDGRQIVLTEKPTQYVNDAIVIHYRRKNGSS